ncbi:MAG: FtsX-like permease family protein [Pseudomonadota bacterium]|nr:FtsX-like permease family protein [Pseudomonadota bacterium]
MTIFYALKQIRNHWVRTLLAVLGVLIGTCAFIVLINIGLIFKYNMEQELNQIGKNIHIFNLLYPTERAKFITQSQVNNLIVPPVKNIIPIATKSYNYNLSNGKNINLNIIGIPFNMEKPFDINVSQGRLIIPSDERNVTISQPLADEFNDNNEPMQIGFDLLLEHQVLHIVGTHQKQKEGLRTLLFGDVNHQIVMNLDSALKFMPNLSIERLIIELESDDDSKHVLEKIKKRIETLSPDIQVFIQSFTDFYKSTNTITSQFNLFLTLVGSIALLIGGVGIMNIMLVVVTERQGEIGLRMALGANGKQIIALFLIESIIICLLGGIIGIILAMPILYFFMLMTQAPMMFFPKTLIIGFSIPIMIGLFFGIFPAIKASRMDPIKALHDL